MLLKMLNYVVKTINILQNKNCKKMEVVEKLLILYIIIFLNSFIIINLFYNH